MLKPSDFCRLPISSRSGKYESEQVALNIMIMLARTGDKWRDIGLEEYKELAKQDHEYMGIYEENCFDSVRKYTVSPEEAAKYSQIWEFIYNNDKRFQRCEIESKTYSPK